MILKCLLCLVIKYFKFLNWIYSFSYAFCESSNVEKCLFIVVILKNVSISIKENDGECNIDCMKNVPDNIVSMFESVNELVGVARK